MSLSSQISLTTRKIKNFDIYGMHAQAASLMVHQIELIRTISVSTPCLVGTHLDELVVTLPVAVHMNMNTKTEDIQKWRKMFLILSLCYNACVILLGPATYQS